MEKKQETIKFNNPPQVTRALVQKWLMSTKKEKGEKVHIAILEDILKMIDVALTHLVPEPAEPETKK